MRELYRTVRQKSSVADRGVVFLDLPIDRSIIHCMRVSELIEKRILKSAPTSPFSSRMENSHDLGKLSLFHLPNNNEQVSSSSTAAAKIRLTDHTRENDSSAAAAAASCDNDHDTVRISKLSDAEASIIFESR